MEKICCVTLEAILNQECKEHGESCPDKVIRKFDGCYGLPLADGSYFVIYFCPFCSAKLDVKEDRWKDSGWISENGYFKNVLTGECLDEETFYEMWNSE